MYGHGPAQLKPACALALLARGYAIKSPKYVVVFPEYPPHYAYPDKIAWMRRLAWSFVR
ncbi:hypothetical protein DPMN_143178 [Dreissena polymorpha]|uniref:Uncharacterized protein n=1 Tax=Dreissena polymorpha TaxID=45954 RepID=A0A9D4JP35_DREPO|nr:hypothetical protein DPMN_143178 [Dreissena polymorpha]